VTEQLSQTAALACSSTSPEAWQGSVQYDASIPASFAW